MRTSGSGGRLLGRGSNKLRILSSVGDGSGTVCAGQRRLRGPPGPANLCPMVRVQKHLPRSERQLKPPPAGLVRAARKVLLRYGVRKSTMADIADEAGIPRPTLYEYFANRHALIDAVIADRVRSIVGKLLRVVEEAPSFTDAVVEASVLGIELTRTDRELANIFATTPYKQVHQIMEGPNPV